MITGLLAAIAALVIKAVNALILGLGTLLLALVSLLPDMPAIPDPPEALLTAEAWVAWVFPVGTLLDILAFTLTVWLLWQLVAILLRWAKATGA